MSSSNPLKGAVSALLLLALCTVLEYLFHWLVVPALFVLLCAYLLAACFVDWLKGHRQEAIEAVVAGLPFALILLAVFQLK